MRALWHRIKLRATESTIPCTITLQEIIEKLEATNGICPATGDLFNYDLIGTANPYSPSLDQIVPGLGYTIENTQIVCWWYNAAKGDWFTDEEARIKFGTKPSIVQ